MTKVRVSKSTTVESEIDVTFPLYKEGGDSGEHGAWDHFYRFDEDGTVWILTRRLDYGNDQANWEIEQSKWLYPNRAAGWDLGSGTNYAGGFNQAWRQAMEFLSSAKPADTPETA